jgi:hypothetical protein
MASKTRDGLYRRGQFWWLRTDPVTRRPLSTRCRDFEAAKLFRVGRERLAVDPHYRADVAKRAECLNGIVEPTEQTMLLSADKLQYLTPEDVAQHMRCHPRSAFRMMRKLGALRAGESLRVNRMRFLEWAATERHLAVALELRNNPGRVYFIQSGNDGPIKIGTSMNIPVRLAHLRADNPYALYLLGTIPGGSLMEEALHRRFASDRIHNEWFAPTAALLDFIAAVVVRAEAA